jgi:hypothetical protein
MARKRMRMRKRKSPMERPSPGKSSLRLGVNGLMASPKSVAYRARWLRALPTRWRARAAAATTQRVESSA